MATAVHVGIALVIRLVLEPQWTGHKRHGYLFEDWVVFVILLILYAGSVLAVVRIIGRLGVSDRFSILRELATCFASWVLLAGSYFVYMLAAMYSDAVMAFERASIPAHSLLLFMMIITYHASLGMPLVFGRRGLVGFVVRIGRRLANCMRGMMGCRTSKTEASSPGQDRTSGADDDVEDNDEDLATDEREVARVNLQMDRAAASEGAHGKDAAAVGLLRLLGLTADQAANDMDDERDDADGGGTTAYGSQGYGVAMHPESSGGGTSGHGGAATAPAPRSRAGGSQARTLPFLRSVAAMTMMVPGSGSERSRNTGSGTEFFGSEPSTLLHEDWAAVMGRSALSQEQQGRIDAADLTALKAAWSLPAILSAPPATFLLRRFAQQLLCPEVIDFYVAVVEYRAVVGETQKRARMALRRLRAAATAGVGPMGIGASMGVLAHAGVARHGSDRSMAVSSAQLLPPGLRADLTSPAAASAAAAGGPTIVLRRAQDTSPAAAAAAAGSDSRPAAEPPSAVDVTVVPRIAGSPQLELRSFRSAEAAQPHARGTPGPAEKASGEPWAGGALAEASEHSAGGASSGPIAARGLDAPGDAPASPSGTTGAKGAKLRHLELQAEQDAEEQAKEEEAEAAATVLPMSLPSMRSAAALTTVSRRPGSTATTPKTARSDRSGGSGRGSHAADAAAFPQPRPMASRLPMARSEPGARSILPESSGRGMSVALAGAPRNAVSPMLLLDKALQSILARRPGGTSLSRPVTPPTSPTSGPLQDPLAVDRAASVRIASVLPSEVEAALVGSGSSSDAGASFEKAAREGAVSMAAGHRASEAGGPATQVETLQPGMDGEMTPRLRQPRRLRTSWAEATLARGLHRDAQSTQARLAPSSSRPCADPIQLDTAYGIILVDVSPLRELALRIVELFLAPASVLEVNIGDGERRSVGTRLIDALALKTALPSRPHRGTTSASSSARAAVAPVPDTRSDRLKRLGITAMMASFEDEGSLCVSRQLDQLATVFDPALLETVRSTALNVYAPFWRSQLAGRLALLELEDVSSPAGSAGPGEPQV